MKKTLSMLAIMSAVLVSCAKSEINEDNGNPQDEPVYEISISSKDLTFGAEGGDQSVTVTSSEDWYLDGESDWCKVSTSYGSNGDKVTFSADPYENTNEERTATFTFYCGDKDVELVVTQEAKVYSISVEPKELTFESAADEKTVTVASSDDWDFMTEEDWISVSEQNGKNGAAVKIAVTENNKAEIRTGVAIFRCGDKQSEVKITQEAKVFLISIEPKELTFEAEGGEQEVVITSSDEWSASIDEEWINITQYNGKNGDVCNIYVDYNSTEERTGVVTFTCGNERAELTILQKPDNSPIIQFKDQYFLNALISVGVDKSKDGNISEKEATSIVNLNFTGIKDKIRNMDEISYFTSLQILHSINSFDNGISLNLNGLPLSELSLEEEAEIENIEIRNNEFIKNISIVLSNGSIFDGSVSSLNINDCPNLFTIDLMGSFNNVSLVNCNSLKNIGNFYFVPTILDISGCSSLETLEMKHVAQITGLKDCLTIKDISIQQADLSYIDLSNNVLLENLYIHYCSNLQSLDLRNNNALKSVTCTFTSVNSLLLGNNSTIETLNCSVSKLTSIDVSGLPNLKILNCNSNDLESIDITKNLSLKELYCDNNNLGILDISNNTDLSILSCSANDLVALDVHNNKKLIELSCYSNDITELDVSKCTKLQYLTCVSYTYDEKHEYYYSIYENSKCPLEILKLYKYHILDNMSLKILNIVYDGIIEYAE